MAYGIDQEIDQALALMQKILEIMLRIQQENKEKNQTQQSADGTTETRVVPKQQIQDDDVKELDDAMKELNGVKRDIKSNIAKPELSQMQDKGNATESSVLSNDLEKQKQDLKLELDKFIKQLEFAKKELNALNIGNPSALQRFGNKLIRLDADLKILNNRINSFFRSIPEKMQKGAANFLIGRLDMVNEKVTSLKDQLNAKIQENSISQEDISTEHIKDVEKSEATVIKNEKGQNALSEFRTAPQMIADKEGFYRIKDLIIDESHGKFNSMNDSIQDMIEKAVENNRQRQALNKQQNIELSGLKTEIDPKTATIENINSNQNVKTVSSVKEELEAVTLTEYSEHMEEAYHAGFDTDPNVATEITDEEWVNCWEPEM